MVYIFTLQLYCTKLENSEYVLQLACTVWYCSGRDVSGCVMVFTTLHIYNYTHLYTSSDNSGDSGSDLQCSGPESKDVEILTTHVSPCFFMYECIGYISNEFLICVLIENLMNGYCNLQSFPVGSLFMYMS